MAKLCSLDTIKVELKSLISIINPIDSLKYHNFNRWKFVQRTFSVSQAWWCTPIFPAPGRLRHKDGQLEASLGYILKTCFKN